MARECKPYKLYISDINDLYDSYSKYVSLSNTEVLQERLKEQIVIETWKLFKEHRHVFKIFNNNDCEENSFSIEIIEAVNDSLKYFPKSKAKANGSSFGPYVCFVCKNKIKSKLVDDNSDNTKLGINISDDKKKQIKKYLNLLKCYESLFNGNEEEINKNIAKVMHLSYEEVLELAKLANQKKVNLFVESKNKDGETTEVSAIDAALDIHSYNPESPEESYIQKESIISILKTINDKWEEKKDESLSAMLTARLLDLFQGNTKKDVYSNAMTVNRPLVFSSNFDLKSILEGFSFIDKDMLNKFFSDTSFKVPSQEDLARKFNFKSRAGINKKILRFNDSLTQLDYFINKTL